LDACWIYTATDHGKGACDGVGVVLKLTARHIFFLDAKEVEEIKVSVFKARDKQIKFLGNKRNHKNNRGEISKILRRQFFMAYPLLNVRFLYGQENYIEKKENYRKQKKNEKRKLKLVI
jgi:hypothetical protein